MSKGIGDVENTIARCQEMMQEAAKLGTREQAEATIARLREIAAQLEDLRGKFFLKTNLSVRFTSACLKEAEKLRATIKTLCQAGGSEPNAQSLTTEVQELAKKVQLLTEKSTAEGDIVIT